MNDNRRKLYQVSFLGWTPCAMVVARDLNEAIELASDANGSSTRAALAVDATAEWLALAEEIKAHTEAVLSGGMSGVVDYEPDCGWVAV